MPLPRRPRAISVPAVVALLVVAGCGKKLPLPAPPPIVIAAPEPKKVTATVTIAASRDVNPDANGRPSPVVVHVYQLTGDAVFNRAEFFALVDDDKKALGETMISREQYFLQPADQKSVDLDLDAKAGYLGVMAEYRDFRNANWRAVMPAPKGKLTVSVERARVAIAATP